MAQRFFLATLGCPKNEVDSEKLVGRLRSEGYLETSEPGDADLVVVNTCAFIEPAREESINTILELCELRRPGARLAVTGCLAERSGPELAAALPEVDVVAGFGVDFLQSRAQRRAQRTEPVRLLRRKDVPSFDLLELPRPPARAPWAYVKVAEGCDRRCGFCAIPSFRGKQRSRSMSSILSEVDSLQAREIVLVAQDLASFGRDQSSGGVRAAGSDIIRLVQAVAARTDRVRLLYLYPSSLSDALIETILSTGVPYFDLSLQHVSVPLLRGMRRPGSRERFLERLRRIRALVPGAALRSSFILGYPGETEEDHDELLAFLGEAELDWAGFFTFSSEAGTHAAGLDRQVPLELALERLRECSELQDFVTARRRRQLVGSTTSVLIDRPGIGRSFREAPEIDGIVRVPDDLPVGEFADVVVTGAKGPDLVADRPALDTGCLTPATMGAS
ncbi:MAG TPA: 30S ribosomal protein S12 methylthiotransferase RimO [Acidimicrobiales bacterium]|nr:30S ribosomal protein S12 methylthiotransferase RimO [Acidimicrobiales bacterium]